MLSPPRRGPRRPTAAARPRMPPQRPSAGAAAPAAARPRGRSPLRPAGAEPPPPWRAASPPPLPHPRHHSGAIARGAALPPGAHRHGPAAICASCLDKVNPKPEDCPQTARVQYPKYRRPRQADLRPAKTSSSARRLAGARGFTQDSHRQIPGRMRSCRFGRFYGWSRCRSLTAVLPVLARGDRARAALAPTGAAAATRDAGRRGGGEGREGGVRGSGVGVEGEEEA